MTIPDDLSVVRAALAAAVAPLDGLQASPYDVAAASPPQFVIREAAIDYVDLPPRAMSAVEFRCRLIAGPANDRARAFAVVDRYQMNSGPTSIVAALEADKTLGGLITTLSCQRWEADPVSAMYGAIEYIVSTLYVLVV
jgi:hypothetical protein